MAYSAVILAGGRGKRMGYREKSMIVINGQPLITYVLKSLEKVVDEIIISVRDKAQEELLNSILPEYSCTSISLAPPQNLSVPKTVKYKNLLIFSF